MTPEAKVKARVKKVLDKYGVYYFLPATGGYGRAGVPDIIACFNGQFIAIETKAGKGQLTELQKRELRLIEENGGHAFVINETSLDHLEKYFELTNNDDDGRC
jgi:Holliday junction resolvase